MVVSDLLGFRPFATPEEIKEQVSRLGRHDTDEDFKSARTLLILSTSKQQTWLIATNKNLYLVLDDIRKDDPKVQWSVDIKEAKSTKIEAHDYKKQSGLIDLGPKHQYWLYTKRFFQNEDIVNAIRRFIQAA
jgi:hypothetical protein